MHLAAKTGTDLAQARRKTQHALPGGVPLAYRTHQRGAGVGAFAGGAASIGLMAAVNFAIDSDFKWVLLAIALVWLSSLCVFWFEASR